jgi:predicted amidohydrolase YtcJ
MEKGTPTVKASKTQQGSGFRNITLLVVSLVLAYTLHRLYFDGKHCVICSETGIYTPTSKRDHIVVAQCMLVKDDKVIAIGSRDSVRSQAHWWSTIKYTPKNAIVVPGLADSHAHILEYGYKMQLVLDGARSIEEVIQRVEQYILARSDVLNDKDAWIQGMGWDQTRWEGEQFPTAEDLVTPLLKDRPILLVRVDGHANWVSPRVLQIMQEKSSIPDVEGGMVLRDSRGNPTGIFIDQAMTLIPRPSRTPSQRLEYFKLTMDHAVSVGLTSIHDAGVELDDIKFFKQQSAAGNLPIRLYLMSRLPPDVTELTDFSIPRLVNYGKHGRLNLRSVKIFMDGSVFASCFPESTRM